MEHCLNATKTLDVYIEAKKHRHVYQASRVCVQHMSDTNMILHQFTLQIHVGHKYLGSCFYKKNVLYFDMNS